MQDIMIDIETFGTDSNSVVVSISAVNFDLATGMIGGDKFEVGIDLKEQLAQGAVMDADTVMWWLAQSKEAQDELLKIERVGVANALSAFTAWIDRIDYAPAEMRLWGNGATFDNVIVRNLFKRSNIDFVLPFWCDNDVRTLVSLAEINTRKYTFSGVKHNGIDDCLHQIDYCVDAYDKVNG